MPSLAFVLTTLLYPCVLAVLCVGAGLLVDRVAGGFLPGVLLPVVGVAGLIGLSQLGTAFAATAPLTPVAMAVVAGAGLVLGHRRLRAAARARAHVRDGAAMAIVYALALAPVLLAGRPSLTAYQVLGDSAFHISGADYLLHHGRDLSHVDRRNSYGLFLDVYYGGAYPSGADTLFGGSAGLLRLSLLWTFQPFNAFLLATAAGPALVLARRLGLAGAWAAAAAVCATVPALVYGYVLIGSIKEIAALALILGLGALVVLHRRWLPGPLRAAVPFAVLAVGGVLALGVGFGAWVLASAVVLAGAAVRDLRGRRVRPGPAIAAGAAAAALLGAAVALAGPLRRALQVTEDMASTRSAGNLSAPLHVTQAFGAWLDGTYTTVPAGLALTVTSVLVGLTALAAAGGLVHLCLRRALAPAAWLVAMVLVGVALTAYGSTWTDAKTLMLTSPAVILLAWAGVAGLRATPLRVAAPVLAAVLLLGVLASDVVQYHDTDLAPTTRYDELATVDARFAGRGPTLFTDFDEYAMYALRDLDPGGPDFALRPPALGNVVLRQGDHVDLDLVPLAALRAYPLIVTRVDPAEHRPDADYRLAWRGASYEVWERTGSRVLAQAAPAGTGAVACPRVEGLAAIARQHGGTLVAATAPALVPVPVGTGRHPGSWWETAAGGLRLTRPGSLRTTFRVDRAGTWQLWLQGELEGRVRVSVDGRVVRTVSGVYSGKPANPATYGPIPLTLRAGAHRLTVERLGFTLAPGDGGTTTLRRIFLTRTARPAARLVTVAPGAASSLCGGHDEWIDALTGPAAG